MGAANSKWKRGSAKDSLLLISAIKYGESAEVESVFRQNPKLLRKAIDADGWTPLHHACHEGQTELVRFMVELDKENSDRVKKGKRKTGPAYNCKDRLGWSPAFRTNSKEVIELLLQIKDLDVFDGAGDPLEYLMDGLQNAIGSGDSEKVTNWITQHPKLLR